MDLTISEQRKIVKIIETAINVDFSVFSTTTLKSRLIHTMEVFEYRNADELAVKFNKENINKDEFLSIFAVPFTEMFRDPAMWRKLKTELISTVKDFKDYKIYIPACTTGDEYYTLLVLLNELNLIDNVRITVSSWSNKTIDLIKEVKISPKQIELNRANYKRFEGKDELSKYFENSLLKSLQKNTSFINLNLFTGKLPKNQDMIIFRNKFIYLKDDAQNIILNNLYNSLKIGGKLIIGIKENILINRTVNDKFIEECYTERIYKKK